MNLQIAELINDPNWIFIENGSGEGKDFSVIVQEYKINRWISRIIEIWTSTNDVDLNIYFYGQGSVHFGSVQRVGFMVKSLDDYQDLSAKFQFPLKLGESLPIYLLPKNHQKIITDYENELSK